MHKFTQAIIPVFIALLMLAAGWYFFPPAPRLPTGQMTCIFQLAAEAPPARSAFSSVEVSRVNVSARLTNRSEHDGVALWHADGTANFADQLRPVSGVVFLNGDRTVRGIGFWQQRSGQDGDKLRIATLNGDGMLDWNDTVAYVRFESESNKLSHPFRYNCAATVTS